MAQQLNSNLLIQRMQDDIDRQQATIASLKSGGHRCPDAELQLQLMKEDLGLHLSQTRRRLPTNDHS